MSETEPQFKGPAIAVVVPVHNGAAFLQQCLASLAAQTFGDFACFVVDDGSTDESAELAAAWESRDARFVVIHQRQSGVAAARAAGVRAGLNLNARWFAFCDADDCYHKQFWMRCTALPKPPAAKLPAAGMTALPRIFLRKARRPARPQCFSRPPIWMPCCMTTGWTLGCGTSCTPTS